MTPERDAILGTLVIGLAALMFGTVPFFARSLIDAGMDPAAVAFWRFALPGVVLLPYVWRARAERAAIGWALSAGLALGLGWVGYATALKSLPVATAGVLYMTYPLFTVLIGWAWTRTTPSGRAFLAAALVLLGAAVSSSTGPVTAGDLPAMILTLAAPLGFAYGITVLTLKLHRLGIVARMAAIQLGTVLALLPLIALTGAAATLLPATPSGWWLVAGAALVTALLPQLVYTVFAPRIGATRTAIAGTLELPTMFFIGWAAFAEPLGPGQWLACALILAAILLTRPRPTRGGAALEEKGRPKAP